MGASVCVAVVLASSCAMAQAIPYMLTDWACGVIVWPGAVPSYAEHFTQRLTHAAEAAFGFWGYDIPTSVKGAYDEANAFQIHDPATDSVRTIPPLGWADRETLPVVVFAFGSVDAIRLAMGDTELYAAFWSPWPLDPGGSPEVKEWILAVGAGYRNMICTSSATDEVLIHEFAHWFTFQWCYSQGITAPQLPNYIVEGIAEVTCASAKDANSTVYDRLQAYSWAQNKCLTGSIQGVMKYPVGASIVGYLVDTLGTDDFLRTLREWSIRAWLMIDQYQAGWRESLGLPSNCPQEEVESTGV